MIKFWCTQKISSLAALSHLSKRSAFYYSPVFPLFRLLTCSFTNAILDLTSFVHSGGLFVSSTNKTDYSDRLMGLWPTACNGGDLFLSFKCKSANIQTARNFKRDRPWWCFPKILKDNIFVSKRKCSQENWNNRLHLASFNKATELFQIQGKSVSFVWFRRQCKNYRGKHRQGNRET